MPPVTVIVSPVMYEASSEHRKAITPPISSGCPSLRDQHYIRIRFPAPESNKEMKAYENEGIACGQLLECYLTGNGIFKNIINHAVIHFSYIKKLQWWIILNM